MKSHASRADRQIERTRRGESGAGPKGIAIQPPGYGIDYVDRAEVDEAVNRTGMPDALRAGIESLSGIDLSAVRVHASSDEPARIHALAYTQGTEIHLGPGQEEHLPHEAWHVVQQSQGRVSPTLRAQGVAINDDPGLEDEADTMGSRAAWHAPHVISAPRPAAPESNVVQRVTDAPARITVYFERGSGNVARVEDHTGRPIPHVIAKAHKGIVPEGRVVLKLAGQRVVNARFATTAAQSVDHIAGMTQIAAENITVEEAAPAPRPSEVAAPAPSTREPAETRRFEWNIKTAEGESIIDERFTGFESSDQGQIHFTKHGDEFEAVASKDDYIREAKKFGTSSQRDCLEAIIGNTIIKVDPVGVDLRRVFIANAKQIRTFYVWDPDYSSDPFAYAIYYTLTNTMKIPLADVDPKMVAELKEKGIDVAAIEVEEITRQLEKREPKEKIQRQTLAPMKLIERVLSQNWDIQIKRAMMKYNDVGRGASWLTGVEGIVDDVAD